MCKCKDDRKKKEWHLKYPEGMFVIYYLEYRSMWIAEQHLEKPSAWTQRKRQWDNLGERKLGVPTSDERRVFSPLSENKKRKKTFSNKVDFKA